MEHNPQKTAPETFALKHPPANADTLRRLEENPGKRPVHPGSIPTLSTVTNLDIDVTENCNLGCLYCFKEEKYSENMSLETMKKSFEWLVESSRNAPTLNCNFMGGEPTLRWNDIKKFVPWARRRGAAIGKQVTFSMTSNLTLWNDEIRRFVDEYGFGILMSIDGCPEVQDAQRPKKGGKMTSELVEYWARSLLKTRPHSTARSTFYPTYAHKFAKSMRYFRLIGFREVAVSLSEYHLWTDKQLDTVREQLFETVDQAVESHGTDKPFTLTGFKYLINKLIRWRRTDRPERIEFRASPCGAGKGYMMIDYTGDIWPCHRFDGADSAAGADGQFRMGNIFEEGFNHELSRAFLEFDHGKFHKEGCKTCPVNPICGGYCPAANLSDTGSIYQPHDTFCAWSQMMYDAAESLYDRIAEQGAESLDLLLESASGTESDGTT
ncbi:MAG: SPASM domain-containing protein [Planctomycetes bacterium]|nr:SPASM domain-containing protein [Planctomycetota bacterium]